MSQAAKARGRTQDALEKAVHTGALPEPALTRADSLLRRLDATTRVSLLGCPGSGKSSVLNILAGDTVAPVGIQFCTLQLEFGPSHHSSATLRDGSVVTMEGPLDLQQVLAMAPAFLKVQAPLPALRKISLLEVVMPDRRAEQIRAIKWAIKQTDVAIWCTQSFDIVEQALWAGVPDALKDHAILLRTFADKSGSDIGGVMRKLHKSAGADFAHVLPISGKQALAARAASGAIDRAMMRGSGATQLISTILHQIEQNWQFNLDKAEVLLHQHQKFVPVSRRAVSERIKLEIQAAKRLKVKEKSGANVTEPLVLSPFILGREKTATGAETESLPNLKLVRPRHLTQQNAKPIAEVDREAIKAKIKPKINWKKVAVQDINARRSEKLTKALTDSVARLSRCGSDLRLGREPNMTDILDRAVQETGWLLDRLEDPGLHDEIIAKRLQKMVQSADDMIHLLRIEGGGNNATEAMVALLQLKRHFQAELSVP
ncbi:MAG: hypothetical protein AB8B71_02160 [Paracoccaceae bacterium]